MANEGLQESPTKNIIILVVTVTGQGDTPKYNPTSQKNKVNIIYTIRCNIDNINIFNNKASMSDVYIYINIYIEIITYSILA